MAGFDDLFYMIEEYGTYRTAEDIPVKDMLEAIRDTGGLKFFDGKTYKHSEVVQWLCGEDRHITPEVNIGMLEIFYNLVSDHGLGSFRSAADVVAANHNATPDAVMADLDLRNAAQKGFADGIGEFTANIEKLKELGISESHQHFNDAGGNEAGRENPAEQEIRQHRVSPAMKQDLLKTI